MFVQVLSHSGDGAEDNWTSVLDSEGISPLISKALSVHKAGGKSPVSNLVLWLSGHSLNRHKKNNTWTWTREKQINTVILYVYIPTNQHRRASSEPLTVCITKWEVTCVSYFSHGGGTSTEALFGRSAYRVNEGHGWVCGSGTVTGRQLRSP